MAPFGFIDDGLTEEIEVDKKNGLVWRVDEYGASQGQWEWAQPTYGGDPNWW